MIIIDSNNLMIIFTLKNREYVEEYMFEVNDKIFTKFHSDEYIDLIKVVTPQNKA